MNKLGRNYIVRLYTTAADEMSREERELLWRIYNLYTKEKDKRDRELRAARLKGDYRITFEIYYISFGEWLEIVSAHELEGVGFTEHQLMEMYI